MAWPSLLAACESGRVSSPSTMAPSSKNHRILSPDVRNQSSWAWLWSVVSGAASEAVLLGMTETDCMYVVLPMFHIAALSATGAALSVSASVAIRPRFSASRFWRDVRQFEATTFQYLGEILRYVLAQPARDDDQPNSLRAMLGAGITKRVWQQFEERFGPVKIVESYGSSEGVCHERPLPA